ncbi:MAG: hypothetical protein A3C35_03050 [Omnitrophica bacterium RIFCSPHIGHO2_02_FULL_46_11]|nr:MAG: hypothetical protein A3A81_06290 [Omnitrophica bacterium RIFCSPLOWO2_01_FULL_45_10b]OGW87936.1 MAG: hypothetical protein A3C35_03050 [Omnitrophica bacterium RIFCSPHIGHO2_02_FULL_46_11]
MFFLIKILISAVLIAFASWLAGRQTILAGFIIALPLISMISIFFVYSEYRDMEKVNQFAVSILTAVPLSLLFFVPFLLNKWLKMNFGMTYLSAIGCLTLAYFAHHFIFKAQLFR